MLLSVGVHHGRRDDDEQVADRGVQRQGTHCEFLHRAVFLRKGAYVHPNVDVTQRHGRRDGRDATLVAQCTDRGTHGGVVHVGWIRLPPRKPLMREEDDEEIILKSLSFVRVVQDPDLSVISQFLVVQELSTL